RKLRAETQERFLSGDVSVIVATIAFGMGIDKPDVRFVIHADLPKDIESYFQETGRAGRDGARADCILLYDRRDTSTIEYFISQINDPVEADNATRRLESVLDYAQTTQCRRKYLLGYFGERMRTVEKPCCDSCEQSAKAQRSHSAHRSPVAESASTDDSYMNRQKRIHANAYARWAPEEEAELKSLAANGYTPQQISQQLGRNTGAIRSRLKKLGLYESVRTTTSADPKPAQTEQGSTDREEVEAAILAFLREFPFPFFRTRLARILKGVGWAATSEMRESPYFGRFSGATRKSLVEVMDGMLEEGALVNAGRQIKLPPRARRAGGST
ncbi:MAG: hypothetical protein GVY29_08790, partial [Spirochaetes bacterium]|nr:hypothetical protein [Spirochaetota bacterium]